MFQEPLILGNMWLAAVVTYCNAPSLHYVTCHVSGVTRVRVPGPSLTQTGSYLGVELVVGTGYSGYGGAVA